MFDISGCIDVAFEMAAVDSIFGANTALHRKLVTNQTGQLHAKQCTGSDMIVYRYEYRQRLGAPDSCSRLRRDDGVGKDATRVDNSLHWRLALACAHDIGHL